MKTLVKILSASFLLALNLNAAQSEADLIGELPTQIRCRNAFDQIIRFEDDPYKTQIPSNWEEQQVQRLAEVRDPNSAVSRSSLLAKLWVDDAKVRARRDALLERSDVLHVEEGGMGCTFVLRDKENGKILRYKASLSNSEKAKTLFSKESEFAIKAGKSGVGPRTFKDKSTNLLAMEEVEGMNLHRFQSEVLAKMKPHEREQWILNFAETMAKQLEKMHLQLGMVHLDLKPSNILIPAGNQTGKKIFVIDYGMSQWVKDLPAVHKQLNGEAYHGTPLFQGRNSFRGKPGIPDDFESFRHTLEALLTENIDGKALGGLPQHPFLLARPRLHALLTYFAEPDSNHAFDQVPRIDYQLIPLATKKEIPKSQEEFFWDYFYKRLKRKTAGNQIMILFSNSALSTRENLLSRFTAEELKNMIDSGMQENHWGFDPNSDGVVAMPNATKLSEFHLYLANQIDGIRPSVDFKHLRKIRESLL